MMRLTLEPRSMKESKENTSNHEIKNRGKIPLKITKRKNIVAQGRKWFNPSTTILMRIKSLQGVETTQTSFHSLEDWGDLSLLSSLLYDI
jgi:hypothetical protein